MNVGLEESKGQLEEEKGVRVPEGERLGSQGGRGQGHRCFACIPFQIEISLLEFLDPMSL